MPRENRRAAQPKFELGECKEFKLKSKGKLTAGEKKFSRSPKKNRCEKNFRQMHRVLHSRRTAYLQLIHKPVGERNASIVRVSDRRNFARWMRSGDRRMNSATDIEIADHRHFTRATRGNQIVENLVDDRFVESALIAKRPKIEFQRLQLDAEFVRHIVDFDRGEIGLAGARAHTGEFRTLHMDLIIAFRPRIRKNFQFYAWCSSHTGILPRRKTVSKLPS